MIGVLDTLTLARTKLRSKRVLLIITVVVSGMLFGVLAAAIVVTSGVTTSVNQFFTRALNGRYLVEVQPNIPNAVFGYDDTAFKPSKELIQTLTKRQDEYTVKQKAIYDKYKLPFDKSTITPVLQPNSYGQKDDTGALTQEINRNSPVYKEYLDDLKRDYIKTATNTVTDLKKLAGRYGATSYSHNQSGTLAMQATYLKDGKEDLTQKESSNQTSYEDYLTTNILQSSYTFTDQSLMQRFILPQNDRRTQTTDAIPVILTTQEIAKVFGKQLGIGAQPTDPAEQVAWVKNLQQKANGLTYQACYRSPGEKALIQKTMQTNVEMATKAKDPTYAAPSLQYTLPTSPCGELTIKKDTRSASEKKTTQTEEQLQKDLGTYQPVTHQLLTFQIVGTFTLTVPFAQPQNASAYISYLLGPQYSQGAFIPQQLYDKLPAAAQHKDLLLVDDATHNDYYLFEQADIRQTIVSFPTLSAARDFIKKEGCDTFNASECKKPFLTSTYGAAYLAIDDISSFLAGITPIVLLIAMGIATIIIWITMARVIIDSRRETAVFRALGAKRRDIASIYLLYSVLVALLIVIFMLTLGLVAATIMESLFSANATNLAMVAYGVFDKEQPFHFIGINLSALGILALCIIGISLLAVLPPLMRNVRRNPIRDMRDE